MRRASFYIGVIVVLTVAPAALGSWAIEVASVHRNGEGAAKLLGGGGTAWYGLLFYLALAGLIVAAVESRTMASSLLGGHFAQRPITVRQALGAVTHGVLARRSSPRSSSRSRWLWLRSS